MGFQWVEEARARGARVIHVDPRFTRTSAVSDRHIPIRAGSDVVLLGALINYVLHLFGVSRIDWQAGTWSSWLAISLIVTWRWTGYNALIYLASMQAVPFELYESAALDGAGRWRQFRSITIPMLRPTILFTVIVSTIGALQLFGEPLLFNVSQTPAAGGSQHQFQVMAVYTYQTFLGNGKYGYGSAISWAMFLVIVVIVGINLTLVRRLRGVEGA